MDEKPLAAEISRSGANSAAKARPHRHQGREDSLKKPKIHRNADKFAQRAAKFGLFCRHRYRAKQKRIHGPYTQLVRGRWDAENRVLQTPTYPQNEPYRPL